MAWPALSGEAVARGAFSLVKAARGVLVYSQAYEFCLRNPLTRRTRRGARKYEHKSRVRFSGRRLTCYGASDQPLPLVTPPEPRLPRFINLSCERGEEFQRIESQSVGRNT